MSCQNFDVYIFFNKYVLLFLNYYIYYNLIKKILLGSINVLTRKKVVLHTREKITRVKNSVIFT